MKIGTLLSVGIIFIIGLMITASFYSTYLSNKGQTIIRNSTTRIFDVLTIQRDTEELFSALGDIDVIRDNYELNAAKNKIANLHERAIETIRQGEEKEFFHKSEAAKANEILGKVSDVSSKILDLKEKTIQQANDSNGNVRDFNTDEARQLDQQFNNLRNIRFEMLGVVNDITIRSDEEFRDAMDLVQQSQRITWVAIGIGLVLATVLGIFLVRSVKKVFDLKNEFVNIIAHDLRNPVTAIIGYLEMITSDKNMVTFLK